MDTQMQHPYLYTMLDLLGRQYNLKIREVFRWPPVPTQEFNQKAEVIMTAEDPEIIDQFIEGDHVTQTILRNKYEADGLYHFLNEAAEGRYTDIIYYS